LVALCRPHHHPPDAGEALGTQTRALSIHNAVELMRRGCLHGASGCGR
jgi:hypothetical protein